MGWEKVPGAQGTWDRAVRDESGRAALMGIVEDLQWQVETPYMHVFQQLSLFTGRNDVPWHGQQGAV